MANGMSQVGIYGAQSWNIVEDYPWTVNGNKTPKSQAPRIILTEYQQTSQAILQSLRYYFEAAKNVAKSVEQGAAAVATGSQKNLNTTATTAGAASTDASSAYKGLYTADATGNTYTLPYYVKYHHNINNSWGENKPPLFGEVDELLKKGAKLFTPSAGIETAKSWEGTTPAQYEIEFALLNTVASTDVEKNKKFIEMLLTVNLQWRVNAVMSIPPVIYTVEVPGIRYSPVAIINNCAVENMGIMTYDSTNKENVPEAYNIRIQITELVMETRQIYSSKGTVTAIMSTSETSTAADEEASKNKK